jgi:hypothetical protein
MDKILSKAYKVNEKDDIDNSIQKDCNEMTLSINEKNINIDGSVYEICDDPNETRSVFYIDNIKYKIPNPLLDEYSKKYKPEELTDDGIPNIETQLREIEEKDKEQLEKYKDNQKIYNREMVQRVKCLSLNRMGKSIMFNTYDLNNKDKIKLQEIMWSYNDIDHKDIIDEFNMLVDNEIFENKETDLSKLPIYEFLTN